MIAEGSTRITLAPPDREESRSFAASNGENGDATTWRDDGGADAAPPAPRERIPLHHRLSFRQARNTVLLTVVLGLFLSVGQILADYTKLRGRTDTLVEQVLNISRDSAAEAAYVFDKPLAERVVGGLFEYKPIIEAEVRDDFGAVLAAAKRNEGECSTAVSDLLIRDDPAYTLPLQVGTDRKLVGTLRVVVDRRAVAREFLDRAGVVLAAGAMWTLGLGLILMVGFHLSVTRPFLRICDALGGVDPRRPAERPIIVPREHEVDELGLLGRSINVLLFRLEGSLERHRAAETRVREREARLRGIMENTADAIVTIDAAANVETMNPAALALFDCDPDDVPGLSLGTRLVERDARRFRAVLSRELGHPERSAASRREFTVRRRDGGLVPVAMSMSLMIVDERATFVCVVQDITERRRAEAALRESESRLKLAVTATRSGVWDNDLKTGIRWWSPEFMTTLGYAEDAGATLSPDDLIHPDDLAWVGALRDRYLVGEVSDYQPVYRLRRADGSWMWVEARGQCLRDGDGVAYRFTGTMTDVTERKRFEEQLMYMATHDSLTGLPNRALLNDRLQHALGVAARSGHRVAALFIDLDRFKLVNDSLGHNVGDSLLREAAEIIRRTVRPTDTVGRLGGDEFLVIIEDLSDPQDAARVAKTVQRNLAHPIVVGGHQLFVASSVGIALGDRDAIDAATLLRHADAAMYSAKASGGNVYRFFIPEMNEAVTERLILERDLRETIENGAFELHFQPKIDVASLRLIGVESLIRWRHPKRGNVPPGDFIPAAEETGLIGAVGEWVVRAAVERLSDWTKRGVEPLPIAVNVSVRQLTDGAAVTRLREIIERSGVDPALLEIEVTESSMMDNIDAIIETLRSLRALGIRVSIDDFGTGHSSLSYLRRLPINALKIDRSFISDIPDNADDAAITATIIAMGHQLGLTIVAEGIETRLQYDHLLGYACDQAQGYLFARPMAAADLENRFLSGGRWLTASA